MLCIGTDNGMIIFDYENYEETEVHMEGESIRGIVEVEDDKIMVFNRENEMYTYSI
jgi:hypothetical protein